MLGKTVGKYRIVERLGRGGMGTVYKAIDETLDREVAIKVLNADLGDTDLLKRFRAEAVTLARLNHPGIATLYELYRDDENLLMVMEFVRGETVHDLCERLGPLAPPQAAHLAMQVLDALAHAHRSGVVHRDLKPANLMVADTGNIKVMDFGIARVLGTEHFTQGGYMMGTPAYMAPEQVLGGDIDGRADLYAVGVVLYRLLSGQLPFSADTAIAMVQKQVNDSPIPIGNHQPGLPSWCARVLDQALAKAPEDRFQTADDFRMALLSAVQPQALSELPTMATPTPTALQIDAGLTRGNQTTAGYSGLRAPAVAPVPSSAVARGPAPAVPPPGTDSTPAPPSVRKPDVATTTVVLGRKHLFGIGAIALVLLIGLAAVSYVALRRPGFPQLQIGAVPAEENAGQPAGPDGAATAGAPARTLDAAAAQPGAAAPTTGTDAAAVAGARAGAQPKPPAPAAAETAVAGATTPAGARGGRATTAASPASSATDAAPAGSAATAAVTFKDVRLLVNDGADKAREVEGVLQLADGHLTMLDKDGKAPLMSLPYSGITAASYSRSKQPRWKGPDGKDVEEKVDLGKLGFFRSERNWVILFPSNGQPTILRVEDDGLRTVLPAIESHAGIKLRR
jgi:serine/threonine-protein kinase